MARAGGSDSHGGQGGEEQGQPGEGLQGIEDLTHTRLDLDLT